MDEKKGDFGTFLGHKTAKIRTCGAVTTLSFSYSFRIRHCYGIVKEDPMDRFTLGPLALR